MSTKQKLELNWIGKHKRPRLEPRILLEDKELSYGDADSENLLIHGDNLLALKALEQKYARKVQCIYIDPPFNTGEAFDNYEDGLEHSLWLREGANKRGNSSRLTQSFHFFMFEPIFSPVNALNQPI